MKEQCVFVCWIHTHNLIDMNTQICITYLGGCVARKWVLTIVGLVGVVTLGILFVFPVLCLCKYM